MTAFAKLFCTRFPGRRANRVCGERNKFAMIQGKWRDTYLPPANAIRFLPSPRLKTGKIRGKTGFCRNEAADEPWEFFNKRWRRRHPMREMPQRDIPGENFRKGNIPGISGEWER
ncbi:MAG: hypothetical protein C6P37_16245 [Caldibacillus debilis]|uniref:Uncharacterized protein n=1 Tax=Caldibacillus debilis TaxID=301148 RepID=A0A3E0JWT0_9BACI|nr:MAG: hypothetical protein C6P37_16245 [Caldibacillus debilis]